MLIERRLVLELPAVAAAAALLGLPGVARARDPAAPLGFQELTDSMGALARELRAIDPRDEERYLAQVAALAVRLGKAPDTPLGPPYKGLVRTAMSYRGSWIVLVQWKMEKGLVYPAHNHPHYNQVTLGLEGECRIRNYQVVGAAPPPDDRRAAFNVRLTQDALLLPGATASNFSTTRDNIHELETLDHPVRGMDLMTLVGEHEGFSFVSIDPRPADPRRRLHRATWGEHLKG